MWAWKAVSKQATTGMPLEAPASASRAARALAWWSGARSPSASMRARPSPPMRTGPANSEPPWTMRWPTASILPAAPTQPARSLAPTPPGKLRDASNVSPASRTESFRLLEPALTTRIRDASSPTSGGPDPVPDGGFVLTVGPGVRAGLQPAVLHELADPGGLLAQAGHPVDHVHDEVDPVQA